MPIKFFKSVLKILYILEKNVYINITKLIKNPQKIHKSIVNSLYYFNVNYIIL